MVVITSGNYANGFIEFDIEILIPVDDFISGETYRIRLYICDEEGNLVCLLFPYRLTCEGFERVESRGEERGHIEEDSGSYVVWPNPARSMLHIKGGRLEEGSQRSIHLLDHLGRLVRKEVSNDMQITLDIGDLPSGVYFVSIQENGLLVETEKVIIMNR